MTYPDHMRAIPLPTAVVQAAADECRATARLVDDKMDIASTAAIPARTSWTGVYAADFEIAWPNTEESAAELATRLRRLAGELEDAITAAADENSRRAGLRAEYDCQRASGPQPC